MLLDLYLKETSVLAIRHQQVLEEARARIQHGETLSDLEQAGVVHILQVLIENAIGKAKQLLKSQHNVVPTSAYDTFHALVSAKQLDADTLDEWNAIIGLRNRIVHEYMNLDMSKVLEMVKAQKYQLITDFLLAPAV